MKTINSNQNPLVKQLVQLQEKSRVRKKESRFVIEGEREIALALSAGYHLETLLVVTDLISRKVAESWVLEHKAADEVVAISAEVYDKVAYRGSTEGVLAIARSRDHRLEDLSLSSSKPLLLVAEAPEKPGNIGALLRTADAAALDAVIIANPRTDLYNPNIIRSSVGCVFTNQIAMGTTEEIIHYLKQQRVRIYCAALSASSPYHSADFTEASAIVVGTESTGLSEEWLKASDQNIIIPMLGAIDSLNVSVSAAVILFEAKRQRGFTSL